MKLLETFASAVAHELPNTVQPLLDGLSVRQESDDEVARAVLQWLILVFSDCEFGLKNFVGPTNENEAERLITKMKHWSQSAQYPDQEEIATFSRDFNFAPSNEKPGAPVIATVQRSVSVTIYDLDTTVYTRKNACWAMQESPFVVAMARVLPHFSGAQLAKVLVCAAKARAGFDQEIFDTEVERLLKLLSECCLSVSVRV